MPAPPDTQLPTVAQLRAFVDTLGPLEFSWLQTLVEQRARRDHPLDPGSPFADIPPETNSLH